MISFYPGPSKVYESIPQYVREAYDEGILSINHRSPEFIEISKKTINLLKQKLSIPEDYSVFYTSSATECWEIISESLIANQSTHFFNGAFGKKWCEYTQKLTNSVKAVPFNIEEHLEPQVDNSDVICITHNETSNGTAVNQNIIAQIKTVNPNSVVAIDATSSLAGIQLDFKNADIWFVSVQKCLGLPAGLALMICSPKAIAKASELNRRKHYNSLSFMIDKMKDYQTTYTPNVLGIYLLMRTLEDRKNIEQIDQEINNRFEQWMTIINEIEGLKHLVSNPEVHSKTVIPLSSSQEQIELIKSKAKQSGFLLGNGYGEWSSNTFRIANFPAITNQDIVSLQRFLKDCFV